MKLIKTLALLSGTLAAALSAVSLPFNAPTSLANTSLFVTVTNSTGLLPSTGFNVYVINSNGLAYTDINAAATTTGQDVYIPIGSTASMILTDNLLGTLDSALSFTQSTLSGVYGVTNLLNTQMGTFTMATNECPVAISGETLIFTITSGGGSLATSGTFSISNSLSDKTFVATGLLTASGSYTFSNMNKSTSLFTATDTNANVYSVYLGFSDTGAGSFALKSEAGGYETGSFRIADDYPAHFFTQEIPLGGGVYWLEFPDTNLFGYYNLSFFPYVYHYDMGWEYFVDANDAQGGCYLYDFTSRHYFYTSASDFPYLYDFNLNAWLYYYPSSTNSGRYSSNPRYFFNFGTTNIITE